MLYSGRELREAHGSFSGQLNIEKKKSEAHGSLSGQLNIKESNF